MGCKCGNPQKEEELKEELNYENNLTNPEKENVIEEKYLLRGKKNTIEKNQEIKIDPPLEFLSSSENNNKLTSYENNNFINNIEENENEEEELLPNDDFSKYIFNHINLIRENPKQYISIIEEKKKNIQYDKNNRLIYKSKVKVALTKGEIIFNETIHFLEEISPMKKLKFKPEITIKIPNTIEEIKDKTYMKIKVRELLNNNININSYWRDNIKDPETSFILMIVDDQKKSGMKRKDILNPDYKYIGISSVMIDKNFACYITLSN